MRLAPLPRRPCPDDRYRRRDAAYPVLGPVPPVLGPAGQQRHAGTAWRRPTAEATKDGRFHKQHPEPTVTHRP
ncbi:hypothetical protein [Actinomadura macra]|uniref:hypothetical protein n=1 Tax=Actinomadura macra TaxID=46164 RepID=UPI000B254982|nr:hypothetical protein [Actinomadura macra]